MPDSFTFTNLMNALVTVFVGSTWWELRSLKTEMKVITKTLYRNYALKSDLDALRKDVVGNTQNIARTAGILEMMRKGGKSDA